MIEEKTDNGRFDPSITGDSLQKKSAKGAVLIGFSQIFRISVQFFSQIVLARLLTASDFGLIAMVMPVLNLAQILNELGFSQAIIQSRKISESEVNGLFWVNLFASAVLVGIIVASSPLIAELYSEPRLTPIICALAGLLLISALSSQHSAILNRKMNYVAISLSDSACIVFAVVAGISTAYLGFGYWSIVIMQAANALSILISMWILSGWRPRRPQDLRKISKLFRFGKNLAFFNILNYLGANVSGVLVGLQGGAAPLGHYDRAYRLVITPLWQISAPIDRIATSLLARTRANPSVYVQNFLRLSQILILLISPAMIYIAQDSTWITVTFYGAQWTETASAVAAFAVAAAFAPLRLSATWLYLTDDRTSELLRVGVFNNVLTIMLALCCALYSYNLIVIGYSIAYVASALSLLYFGLGTCVSRGLFVRRVFPILFSIGFASAITQLQLELSFVRSARPLVIHTISIVLFYISMFASFIAFKEGRDIVKFGFQVAKKFRS